MNTEDAFLAAMAADPDDDTARLAFADWLEERGHAARAEFIRLQCGPAADPDAARARVAELERAHKAEWDRPLAPLAADVRYRRGFPRFLKAELARLVEHQRLLGLAPEWHLAPTRDGRGDDDPPETDLCGRLAAGPCADRVRGLNFAWAGWHQEELAALVPPLAGRLRELLFGDAEDALDSLDLLTRLPDLRPAELGFVGDSYGGIGDEGCRRLAGHPGFAALTVLDLSNNDLTAAGAQALAGSPHLTGLRALGLAGGSNSTNNVRDDGAAALAGSANVRHIADLNLACNGLTDDGFRALLGSPHLGALICLNLPMNELSDAALAELAGSDGLPALRWLNVSRGFHARVTAGGVTLLARSPRMARLTALKVGGHPIGPDGARALAESPNCRNLRELHVGRCEIGPDGFARLLESPHLAGVREFSTYGNGLSDADVAALRARHGDRVK